MKGVIRRKTVGQIDFSANLQKQFSVLDKKN